MSDDEEITKPKRVQSEEQKEALKKCVDARKLKADTQKEVKVKQVVESKLVKLKAKEKKLLSKLPQPESSEEEEEEPEIVVLKRHKKPKKKIIVVEESESEEDEEPVRIQRVKKPVKVTAPPAVVEPINNICFC
jgi:hypothetical protein